ncbi:DUF4383 domain-containing protein [Actinokineospora diospyrosa]|uniref:DUF4383 domain-containing protein n=1 Tax=Actinokineospora diospyrosa TaxID=103728 RepID=A0ABT1I656_9PSEU|nr:DUF4383 domain-containing protein [Actinokineospora diospyrosa]MCP2268107.1 protein of unknown function (DUF4383) [Actinokineospora diospyrosa]
MSTAHHYPHSSSRDATTVLQPVRAAAVLVASGFLLVGVLGFVPGVTSHLDELTFAGHHGGALLLGTFAVSVLHNLVHLAFGAAGLVMARRDGGAREFLVVGGLVYLALWAYGMLIDHDGAANFIPINNADNWLHLGLGAAMVLLGMVFGVRVRRTPVRLD